MIVGQLTSLTVNGEEVLAVNKSLKEEVASLKARVQDYARAYDSLREQFQAATAQGTRRPDAFPPAPGKGLCPPCGRNEGLRDQAVTLVAWAFPRGGRAAPGAGRWAIEHPDLGRLELSLQPPPVPSLR